jgi:hypothetical protein
MSHGPAVGGSGDVTHPASKARRLVNTRAGQELDRVVGRDMGRRSFSVRAASMRFSVQVNYLTRDWKVS